MTKPRELYTVTFTVLRDRPSGEILGVSTLASLGGKHWHRTLVSVGEFAELMLSSRIKFSVSGESLFKKMMANDGHLTEEVELSEENLEFLGLERMNKQ